jgi:capsular exopolysaccharide synthesis family protein
VNYVRLVEEATTPAAPIRPNVVGNIVWGVILGIAFGASVAAGRILADASVRSREDIESELRAAFLGIMPRIATSRGAMGRRDRRLLVDDPLNSLELTIHKDPMSVSAETCRAIRTNLMFMSPDRPLQAIMVASGDPREGKTFLAVSLAITFAQSGKKVLLVDTDLRRPRIASVFGARQPVGMTSVLVHDAQIEEAIFESAVPNLDVLPCGHSAPNPAELLESQRFREVLQGLRGKYDRIVFDTPPIGAVSDALIVAAQMDATVFVTRALQTRRSKAKTIIAQLRGLGARLAGVVLNDVDLDGDAGAEYYAYYGAGARAQDARTSAA